MKIYLLRHGRTEWNDQRRYQGQTDVPLSPEGEAELSPADFAPERVYVSPLSRARRTAARLFPGAEQIVVPGLAEMDFGAFEGRTADEMADDPAYRAWVDGYCQGRCPPAPDRPGESLPSFTDRTCAAFCALLDAADKAPDAPPLVMVTHGGVQMAVMKTLALPEKDRYEWLAPNGGGFVLEWDGALWRERRKLRCVETVGYARC